MTTIEAPTATPPCTGDAIIRGSEPLLVRFLLDQGADLEAVNEKGWTPVAADVMAEGVF